MTRRQRRELLARRRAKAALLAACLFAVVVLATSLPLRTLLQQRTETAATAATVRHLAAGNRALAAQVAALKNPSTIRALARSEFDYVTPGQKLYDVVPPTTGAAAVGVGHVSLSAPVALPGSAASAAAIGAASAVVLPTGGAGAGSVAHPASGGGFVVRMLRALEFWG